MITSLHVEQCMYCAFACAASCKSAGTAAGCINYRVTTEANTPTNTAKPPEVFDTPRSRLLNEVMEIVHKDRNANYGNPEDNFLQIANLWMAYKKGVNFTAADVAIMNMLIKVARLSKNQQHHDSAVDIAGYAACLADIQSVAKEFDKANGPSNGQAKT